jgi:hypothetical protein
MVWFRMQPSAPHHSHNYSVPSHQFALQVQLTKPKLDPGVSVPFTVMRFSWRGTVI